MYKYKTNLDAFIDKKSLEKMYLQKIILFL